MVPVLASFLMRRGVHRPRTLAGAPAARRLRGGLTAALPIPGASSAPWLRGGGRRRGSCPARQDLHADHGRGRPHSAAGKAASIGLDQTIALDDASSAPSWSACRRSRPSSPAAVPTNWAGSHGTQPDRHLHGAKPRDYRRIADPGWLTDQLRAVMADFPGIGHSFTQPIDMRVAEMLTGVRATWRSRSSAPTSPPSTAWPGRSRRR